MKGFGEIVVIAVISTMLFMLAGGCASLQKAGENIDAGAVISAAAAGASGDYAKALSQIAKMVEKRAAKGDPLAGYSFTRTYFYDGAPVPDPSRITWEDKWTKTGSAGKDSVPAVVETGTASSVPEADADAALAEKIAELLVDSGLAEE